MKKHTKIFFLTFLFLSACAFGNPSPERNREAHRSFLLHGTIDPGLDLKFRVKWASDCTHTVNYFEGASGPVTMKTPLEVARQGNTFSAFVPTDSFLPGRCNWRFEEVYFDDAKSGQPGSTIVQNVLIPLKSGQSPDGLINYKCDRKSFGESYLHCHRDKQNSYWYPETKDIKVNFHLEK